MLSVSHSAPLRGKSPHDRRIWAARVGLTIVGCVVLFLGLSTINQARAEETDLREMPAPGRLLQVDGHAMHLWCTGSGAPTVVLVSGNVSYSLDWTLVQPTLSNTTGVCSYDRAGLGWSKPNPAPRTASSIADELGALIATSCFHIRWRSVHDATGWLHPNGHGGG